MRTPGKMYLVLGVYLSIAFLINIICNKVSYSNFISYSSIFTLDSKDLCLMFSSVIPIIPAPEEPKININNYSYVITEKQQELLQEHVKDILVGSILGDKEIKKSNNYYFKFKQSTIHIEYLAFIFLILKPWLTKGSPCFSSYLDTRYNKE